MLFNGYNLSKEREKELLVKKNEDCPFPLNCCHHPIFSFENTFCCSGYGMKREKTLAYIYNYVKESNT